MNRIQEAIAHFEYGLTHDIFSEPVTSYAKAAVAALRAQAQAGRDTNVLTNADRIRAMSDVELAKFLCDIRSKGSDGFSCSGCVAEQFCDFGHKGTVDWLQQPADEESK